jgi:hypothetical protein
VSILVLRSTASRCAEATETAEKNTIVAPATAMKRFMSNPVAGHSKGEV